MSNILKLKGRMVELNTNIGDVSEKLHIARSTFYNKCKNNGEGFSVGEVRELCKILRLDQNTLYTIFFE